MIVNGNIEVFDKSDYSKYAGLLHNNRAVYSFEKDMYRFGLTLIRGWIGGGYVSSTHYNSLDAIAYSNDTWTTNPSSLNYQTWYGTGLSSLTNGYVNHNNGSATAVDRFNFATTSVQANAARNYSAGGSPSACQHGVGFLPSALPSSQGGTYNTLASYGTRGYEVGKQTTNWDALTFSTEAWQAMSSGPSGGYGIGWFNKDYSYHYASAYGGTNTVTNQMAHSTETWGTVTTTSSPGALGMPSGGAEKGVNSKQERFYLAGNWGGTYCGGTDGNRIFKFNLSSATWSINSGVQTLYNNEHAGLMGMTWGYFGGGYNCNSGQNAHTDKINYQTDAITNIANAPRSMSSGSPMWASY